MLVEGGVALTVAEQHDHRILTGVLRRGCAQRLAERGEGGVQRADAQAVGQRQMSCQDLARSDGIRDARRRAQVVLEHLEDAVCVAHDVQPGDGDPRANALAAPGEQRLIVLGGAQRTRRHDAVVHDAPLAVDVAHEQLHRADALGDTGRQLAPLRRLDQTRDGIDAEVLRPVGGAEADPALTGVAGHRATQLAQVRRSERLVKAAIGLAVALVEGHVAGAVGAPAVGRHVRPKGRRHRQPTRRRTGLRASLRWGGLRHTRIVSRRSAYVAGPTSKMALGALDCARTLTFGALPISIARQGSQ